MSFSLSRTAADGVYFFPVSTRFRMDVLLLCFLHVLM